MRYWVERIAIADHCLPAGMGRLVRALDEAGVETAMPAQRIHLAPEPGGTER